MLHQKGQDKEKSISDQSIMELSEESEKDYEYGYEYYYGEEDDEANTIMDLSQYQNEESFKD